MFEATLPLPDAQAQAQAQALGAYLHAQMVRSEGQISFSRYFDACLYHPEYGYYTSSLPKFGSAGDFVTAPLISPYFSFCLANQIIEVFAALETPVIVELGAGSGQMAVDILSHLKTHQALPDLYYILEVSPALIARQQALLKAQHGDIYHKIHWIDAPLTEDWQGVLLANEVLDALAPERFTIKSGAPHYMDVGYTLDGVLQFETRYRGADHALIQFVASLEEEGLVLAEGYESEYCPIMAPWLKTITCALTKGVALFIDYGHERQSYYGAHRAQGTLMAYYHHHLHHDPYIYPGIQDLTVNVDFTALAEAGVAADFEFLGYTTQLYFLYGCGLEALLIEAEAKLDSVAWFKVAQGAQKLVAPLDMGERFKVMALGRGINTELMGFELNEFSHLL